MRASSIHFVAIDALQCQRIDIILLYPKRALLTHINEAVLSYISPPIFQLRRCELYCVRRLLIQLMAAATSMLSSRIPQKNDTKYYHLSFVLLAVAFF